MNNFNMNYIKCTDKKQSRIEQAEKFFDLLYGKITGEHYSYLWIKQGEKKATHSFLVSNADARHEMATKAIEENDSGADIYFGVNLVCQKLSQNERAKNETVSLQIATVSDIDVAGGKHISSDKKIYPPTFDEAKAFLPFDVSIFVNSGYGGHFYCLYSEPIPLNEENRTQCLSRNKNFIDSVRRCAGRYSKAVDGVGDLPRVLRVPGTYNYKLGRENAPLCHVVEVTDVRFTPSAMDEKLNALTPPKLEEKSVQQEHFQNTLKPSEQERALAMLRYIPCAELDYEEWLNLGMALKNNGNSCADWENWSRTDERFKAGECEAKWKGFTRTGLTIAAIHELAQKYGYSEHDFQCDWFAEHSPKKSVTSSETATDEPKKVFTREKIPSCPVNLLLPFNFEFDENGIVYVVPPKKPGGDIKTLRVTNTAIVPTKKFRDPVKGTAAYEFAVFADDEWYFVEVDGATLADGRELSKSLAKHHALISEPKFLLSFLNKTIGINSANLPKIKSYSQCGWTSDDCEEFAFPSPDFNAVIRRTGYDFERIFKPKGDADAWKQKFVEVTQQGGAVARLVIGSACAAPLVRVLGIINIQLHLAGNRSIGKSPLCKFAVSIFGDSKIGALSQTFAATAKSQLETAAAFRDLPLIFDELEALSKRDAEKLPENVYNFSLGISGQALKVDGTRREQKEFSGARLTTGEHQLVHSFGNAGEYKRVLDLYCTELLDEEFAADLHGFCNKNHGLLGATWIRYIQKHRSMIEKHYHTALKDIAANVGKENDRTQLAMLAACAIAFQHFKICVGLQNLETDADAINAEMNDDIAAIIRQLPTAADMDDATRAINFLRDFVAGHQKYFLREVNRPDFDNEFSQQTYECYGKIFKDGRVAFLITALTKILETDGKFKSAKKLRHEFCETGFLIHSPNRDTCLVKFGGTTQRMILFQAGLIADAQNETDEETVAFQ